MKNLLIYVVLLGGCLQLSAVPTQARKATATIRHIAVTGSDHAIEVEITATASLTPLTQTVTDPDRLIVDLPEALPSEGVGKVFVNRGNLKDIRIGLLSAVPRITRVVLDLTSPTHYRVSPSGNTIVVKLEDESGPVAAATEPPAEATPVESTSVNANQAAIQPNERSRARWIFPILLSAGVLAMLIISLVNHIQNRRASRGI